eukprot:m.81296 g.81296  ORF g.81296 m.81296 type:complete len:97 (+) comp19449_c0_seq1:643-933(+)
MTKLCPQADPSATLPETVPARFSVVKRAGENDFRACIGCAKGSRERPSVPTVFVGKTIESITEQIVAAWPEVTGCRRLRRSRSSPSKSWILVPRFE